MYLRIELTPRTSRFLTTRAAQAAEEVVAASGATLADLAAALRVGTTPPVLEDARIAAQKVVKSAGVQCDVEIILHS